MALSFMGTGGWSEGSKVDAMIIRPQLLKVIPLLCNAFFLPVYLPTAIATTILTTSGPALSALPSFAYLTGDTFLAAAGPHPPLPPAMFDLS